MASSSDDNMSQPGSTDINQQAFNQASTTTQQTYLTSLPDQAEERKKLTCAMDDVIQMLKQDTGQDSKRGKTGGAARSNLPPIEPQPQRGGSLARRLPAGYGTNVSKSIVAAAGVDLMTREEFIKMRHKLQSQD